MIINHLPSLLLEKQMSIRELARQTGVTYTTVRAFYHMDRRSIQFSVLEAICLALDVQPGELFVFRPRDTMPEVEMEVGQEDARSLAHSPLSSPVSKESISAKEDWQNW